MTADDLHDECSRLRVVARQCTALAKVLAEALKQAADALEAAGLKEAAAQARAVLGGENDGG